ncbi:MAG: gliding motility-associated ABC transporter ATP-binding subunit GldA [Candidatus Coatesbacteria bacterium]|nr:MAG: gliding motility-associated ABC transporter ATP-binding subunit GldA [Candidatus Coatesbacteria bacterium]
MSEEVQDAVNVVGLSKWFGERKVLSGVSFAVRRLETVGLLGPNGAGKTTIMRIIAGVLRQDAGRVSIEGVDVASGRDYAIRKIGYMPEKPPLYRELTVAAYLRFWARLRDVPRHEVDDRVQTVISSAGLDDVRNITTRKLSKGYGQRLNLAQAIVHDPSVVILDEPTSGLDPDQIVKTRELIFSLGTKKTLIISSHILADVAKTCDRVIIINAGRVVGESLPALESEKESAERITSLERLYLETVHNM